MWITVSDGERLRRRARLRWRQALPVGFLGLVRNSDLLFGRWETIGEF